MIYLDNNATTIPLPEVVESMARSLRNHFANPSSAHPPGRSARRAIESARETVAAFLGCSHPGCIIFTSSATESIRTVAGCLLPEEQFVLSTTEHSSIFSAARALPPGAQVTLSPVDRNGVLNLVALEEIIQKRPALVNVAAANSETGVLLDLYAVSALCKKYGARLHIDAAQTIGRVSLPPPDLYFDFLSFSAHKFHGPKGCGVLFARKPSQVRPLFSGHQEHGLRAGTENVPAIFATSVALACHAEWKLHARRMAELKQNLENEILLAIPNAEIHSTQVPRLPNTTSIHLPKRNAADVVQKAGMEGLCISAGAACSNGGEPSHVLLAMGYDRSHANETIRLSLSRLTTPGEIADAVAILTATYRALPACHSVS